MEVLRGQVSEQQAALQRMIQELKPLLNPVKPSEELAQAQAEYDAAEEQHSLEVNPARKRALCRELARCGDRLEDVERQEKAKVELLQEQLRRVLSKHHGEFSPSGHQRSEEPGEDATQATPNTSTTGINTGLDNDRATNPATESPRDFQIPVHDTVRAGDQSTEPPGDILQAPDIRETIEPRSTTPQTHTPIPPRRRPTTVDQQDRVEQTGRTSGSNKRRATTYASRRTKHQRQTIATGPLTKNTIQFNEVYGDGQVNRRCRIMERDGYYYIFKCKKPNKPFDAKNPLQAAMSHLKAHAGLKSSHDNAFGWFGSQVVDCTEARCAENNRAVDRYLEEQEYKKERRKACTPNLERYPRTGETYMAWWDDDDGSVVLHALLVIPFSEPGYGVDICVENSDLGDDIPDCYESNGTGAYDWAEGYKDGGEHVKNRIYPIMCFDGETPHNVAWLPVEHFRILDVHDKHLDYTQAVNDYIASRSNSLGNEIEDESEDLYEDSLGGVDDGDGDGPTSSGHTQTHIDRPSETVHLVEDGRTRTTMEIQESHPQRDVKLESSTQPSGRRQMSIQRRWPIARRSAPDMVDFSDSD
ncbi:hypothetical protein IL306_002539 [Fusarium sp. DS 682]|nr:hypothetical protein IL306_002539 [Fusarium sp. DS 682]